MIEGCCLTTGGLIQAALRDALDVERLQDALLHMEAAPLAPASEEPVPCPEGIEGVGGQPRDPGRLRNREASGGRPPNPHAKRKIPRPPGGARARTLRLCLPIYL